MAGRGRWITLAVAASLAGTAGAALAQSSVTFGRITAVSAITESDARARTGGAIVGGTLGAAVGSGRSGSNRALGGVGGAFAGSQIGRLASQRQAFEYTILLGGTQTITMITDQAGKRVGDCVAVERGAHNNLRLVADAKCATPARATPTQADQRQSDACVQAKDQLLAAATADAFDLAERRVRLLCGE
jgi:outer membrane lipoprotein SlyB